MEKIIIDESQNVEFKETWHDDYMKWICGFSNAQGGRLYIGINDAHEIIGVDNAKKLLEDIPNKIISQLNIKCDVNLLQNNNINYIEIVIEPNSVPVSYHGKYHYRSGSTMQELNGMALQQFIMKKMKIRGLFPKISQWKPFWKIMNLVHGTTLLPEFSTMQGILKIGVEAMKRYGTDLNGKN